MALRGGWRAPDERVGAYTAAVRYVPAQGGRYRIEALRRIVRLRDREIVGPDRPRGAPVLVCR